MKAVVKVIQEPTYVKITCPFCNNEIEVSFNHMLSLYGCCEYWSNELFECEYCERLFTISSVEGI